MKEGIEKVQSGREILKDLESAGVYVFHGSPKGEIEILEPRQGMRAAKSNEMITDGDPAVSATPYVDISIFRAIVSMRKNSKISNYNTSFGVHNGELKYGVSSQDILDEAKNNFGYVYVFNKSDFEPYDRSGNASDKNMEWRSYKPVKPIQVVEVNFNDLPDMEKIIVSNE